MNKYILSFFFLFYNLSILSITLQPHEEWWQKNLDTSMHHFTRWLGDSNASSRQYMREHIKKKHYVSILDIPCGLGIEYEGFIENNISITYYGIDITEKLIMLCKKKGIPNISQGTIEKIPLPDFSIDICYARHILEHLSYYTKALNELIRVAKKEVLIVFFMKPIEGDDVIDRGICDFVPVYHNKYNKKKIENYLIKQKRVSSIEWKDINDQEIALHIYLIHD